jgi:hypothetical protein
MSKLTDQLLREASAFGIRVDLDAPFNGIELSAPEGKQFDEELHHLVSAPWDNDSRQTVIRAAIKDVRTYGPRIKDCPPDCPCRETE